MKRIERERRKYEEKKEMTGRDVPIQLLLHKFNLSVEMSGASGWTHHPISQRRITKLVSVCVCVYENRENEK